MSQLCQLRASFSLFLIFFFFFQKPLQDASQDGCPELCALGSHPVPSLPHCGQKVISAHSKILHSKTFRSPQHICSQQDVSSYVSS